MTNVQHETDDRSVAQLEEEGDIAADYIEELLDICDLDGDIDIDARNGRAYVSVNAGDGASRCRPRPARSHVSSSTSAVPATFVATSSRAL